MRCRNCDYPLWTIEARTCPECGTSFLPSEYRFRAGAVRFCCPGCRSAYYGTSSEGQPVPDSFACAGCGRALTVDELILEPEPGVRDDEVGLPPNPWMERHKSGFVRAWFRSVVRILGAPSEFIRSIPARAPISDAVIFAATTSLAGVLFVLVIGALVLPVLVMFVPMPANTWFAVLVQVALLGASVIWVIIGTLTAGVCAHLILKLLRGAHGGTAASMQAILYAHGGTNAINLIPCPCSGMIVPIWCCVTMAIMLRVVHRTSTAKSVTAAIAAAIVAISVTSGLAFIPTAVGWTNTQMRVSSQGLQWKTGGADTSAPLAPILRRTEGNPRTVLDLLASEVIDAELFLTMVAPREEDRYRLGLMDADDIRFATPAELRREADLAAARLPAGDAPYRLGRAVFYNRGATSDANDWLVVIEPRRANDGSFRDRYRLIRDTGDTNIDRRAFPAVFEAECKRLTSAGRPPLTAPETVVDLFTGLAPFAPPAAVTP